MNKFHAVLLICLGLLIYSNVLSGRFVFDDITSIKDNEFIKVLDLRQIFRYKPTRFIPYLTFALNYKFWGNNTFSYHLLNILLHIAAAFTVYWLVNLLFPRKSFLPLFTSLIFLTHPIQTQAVSYITQRIAVLAALFYLLSLVFFVKYVISISDRRSGKSKKALFYYLLSLMAAFSAFFSKENTFTLPLIIFLIAVFFLRTYKKFSSLLLLIIPFFAAAFVSYRTIKFIPPLPQTGQQITDISAKENPHSIYALTQINVARTYLRLLFLPLNQNLDYDYPLTTHFDTDTFLSLLLLILIISVAVFLKKKNSIILFGLLFFLLTLSIESYFPLEDVIMEHRLYLPSLGIILIISAFLCEIVKRLKHFPEYLSLALPVCVILLFSFLTYQRNRVWQDELSLWSDVVLKSPNLPRAHNNLGLALKLNKQYFPAAAEFNQAVSLNPKYVQAYLNLANVYKIQKENSEAEKVYYTILKFDPNNPLALSELSRIYVENGQIEKGENLYKQALLSDPQSAFLNFGLGQIYAAKGDYEKAEILYAMAIKLQPAYLDAYFRQAEIYIKKGKTQDAKSNLEKIIAISPYHQGALINLGILNINEKNFNKAIVYLERLSRVDNTSFNANFNLGLAYYLDGQTGQAEIYLNKAKELKPQSQEPVKILKLLEGKKTGI